MHKFRIFSDSQSALKAIDSLNGIKQETPHVTIKHKIISLLKNNTGIELYWIPAHVGIQGNEMVAGIAKNATSDSVVHNCDIPYTDMSFL